MIMQIQEQLLLSCPIIIPINVTHHQHALRLFVQPACCSDCASPVIVCQDIRAFIRTAV